MNPKPNPAAPGALPYTDAKPVGAADFYLAINATFRFVSNRFGAAGLRQYWTDLGARYFAPVTANWRAGGLPAVAQYWRAFFAAEPGADVEVGQTADTVTLDVKVCPAIRHLRASGREIVPCFCQHCYFIGDAMAAPAGLTVRIEGGNGACRQTFLRRGAAPVPQDLAAIHEVANEVPRGRPGIAQHFSAGSREQSRVSPAGTKESKARQIRSAAPAGLVSPRRRHPALKCWAILCRAFGTVPRARDEATVARGASC